MPRGSVGVAAVRRVRARKISGAFWHQGATGRPLRSFISPSPGDGRYHREGGPGAWYASSKERAAWVELFRHHTSAELSPLEVRRRVGKVEVSDLNVLDLTDPDVRVSIGIDEDLITDDMTLCQEIAEAARSAGFSGILAPSAALSDERTLVVFPNGMRRVHEQHSRIQRPPRSIRRDLGRVRVSGSMRSLIRRWPRE